MTEETNYVQIPQGFIVQPPNEPPHSISLDDAPDEQKKKHPQNQNPTNQSVYVPGVKDIVDMSGDLISDERILEMYNSIDEPTEVTSLVFQQLLDSKRELNEARNKTVESYMTPMPVRELYQFTPEDVESGILTAEEATENNIDTAVDAATGGPDAANVVADMGNEPNGNGGEFIPVNVPKAQAYIDQSTAAWRKIVADTGVSYIHPLFYNMASTSVATLTPDELVMSFKGSNDFLRDPLTISNPEERERHLASQLVYIEKLRERYSSDIWTTSVPALNMIKGLTGGKGGSISSPYGGSVFQDTEDVDFSYFTTLQRFNPNFTEEHFTSAGEAIDYMETAVKMNYDNHLNKQIDNLNPVKAFEQHAVSSVNRLAKQIPAFAERFPDGVATYDDFNKLFLELTTHGGGGDTGWSTDDVKILTVVKSNLERSRDAFIQESTVAAAADKALMALSVNRNALQIGSEPPPITFDNAAASYFMPGTSELAGRGQGTGWDAVTLAKEEMVLDELHNTMKTMSNDPSNFGDWSKEEREAFREQLRGFVATGSIDTQLFNAPYYGTVLMGTVINLSKRQEITGNNPLLSTIGKHLKDMLLLPQNQAAAWRQNPTDPETLRQKAAYTTALFNLYYFDDQAGSGKLGIGFTRSEWQNNLLGLDEKEMEWMERFIDVIATVGNLNGDGTSTDVAKAHTLLMPPPEDATKPELDNYEAVQKSALYERMQDPDDFLANARDMAMMLMVSKDMNHTHTKRALDPIFSESGISNIHTSSDSGSGYAYTPGSKSTPRHETDLNRIEGLVSLPRTAESGKKLLEDLGDLAGRDVTGWGVDSNAHSVQALKILSDWIGSSVDNANDAYHYIEVRLNTGTQSPPTVLDIVKHLASARRNADKAMFNGRLMPAHQKNNLRRVANLRTADPSIENEAEGLNILLSSTTHQPDLSGSNQLVSSSAWGVASSTVLALNLDPNDPFTSSMIGGGKTPENVAKNLYAVEYNTKNAWRGTVLSDIGKEGVKPMGESWERFFADSFSDGEATQFGVDANNNPIYITPQVVTELADKLDSIIAKRARLDSRWGHNNSLNSFDAKSYAGNLMMMISNLSPEAAEYMASKGFTESALGGRLDLPETGSDERMKVLQATLNDSAAIAELVRERKYKIMTMNTGGPPSGYIPTDITIRNNIVNQLQAELAREKYQYTTLQNLGTRVVDGVVVRDERPLGLYRFDSSGMQLNHNGNLEWIISDETGVVTDKPIALPFGTVDIKPAISPEEARIRMSKDLGLGEGGSAIRGTTDGLFPGAVHDRDKRELQSALWNYNPADLDAASKKADSELAILGEDLDDLMADLAALPPDGSSEAIEAELERVTAAITHEEKVLKLIVEKKEYNRSNRQVDYKRGSVRQYGPRPSRYREILPGEESTYLGKGGMGDEKINTIGSLNLTSRLNLTEARIRLDFKQRILDAKGNTKVIERLEIEKLRQLAIVAEVRERQKRTRTGELTGTVQLLPKPGSTAEILSPSYTGDQQDFTTEGVDIDAEPEAGPKPGTMNYSAVPGGTGGLPWMIAQVVMASMPNINNLPPEEYKEWLTQSKKDYSKYLVKVEGMLLTPKVLFKEKHMTVGIGHYLDGSSRSRQSFKDALPKVSYDLVASGKLSLTEKQAYALYENDVVDYINYAVKLSPKFEAYTTNLRTHIVAATYRGSWGGSPKARRLLEAGKYKEAAEEFLDNNEYREAKKPGSGKRGVAIRMEAVAKAIRDEEEAQKKLGDNR